MKITTTAALAVALSITSSFLDAQTLRPTSGTFLHYRFDEPAGSTIGMDSSGNGRHATYGINTAVGLPSFPGLGNSIGVGYTGAPTGYVDPAPDGLTSDLYQLIQGSFTFEAIIKFDSLEFAYNRPFFSIHRNGVFGDGDAYFTVMGSDANFPLALSVGDSSAVNYAFTITPPAWELDQWYHIALTVDQLGNGDSIFTFYLGLAGEAPVKYADWQRADLNLVDDDTTPRILEIGNTWGFDPFPGQIDEVRFSYGALTEFQVIPEPSTLATVAMGFGLLAFVAKRRR